MPSFGERLIQLQTEHKLLKKDVAEAVGISVMAYYRYETGERLPPSDVLSKFADYFEVSADYLLGRSDTR
ncbi:MAG: helix-turn-helix domain-containing protein [Defluviitaleaceae bacterium]|nr:helix-turn-helix domain-containing protein [Defluviitaleaceae bacterium]